MPTIDQRDVLGALTRADLTEAVAASTGLLKQEAGMIVAAVLETMVEGLQDSSRIEQLCHSG